MDRDTLTRYGLFIGLVLLIMYFEHAIYPYYAPWIGGIKAFAIIPKILGRVSIFRTFRPMEITATFWMLVVNIIALAELKNQIQQKKSIPLFVLSAAFFVIGFLLAFPFDWSKPHTLLLLADTLPLPLLLASFVIPKEVNSESHLRGSKKVETKHAERVLGKLSKKESGTRKETTGIPLWKSVSMPRSKENEHLLLMGSPGSGKTQLAYPLIEHVLERGDKAVIWDVKGNFTEAFAERLEVDLLAPWDKRSLSWDIGQDIQTILDCQQFAALMIPANPKDPQPYFSTTARHLLEGVLTHLLQTKPKWGWTELWQTLSQGKEALIQTLKQSPDGAGSVSVLEGDSKSGQDVYSTLLSSCHAVKWFSKAWPTPTTSLREWLHSPTRSLVMSGYPEHRELAQHTANMAIHMLVTTILSFPDDLNHRLWFFLDELATLGRLMPLLEAFSLGRSKGLCVVAGIQDIGKLEHLYGLGLAKSISNTFSTTIVLRCSDSETSRWASHLLGEEEIKTHRKSKTVASNRDSLSESEHIERKPLVLASEISNLENLEGFLRISGWPIAKLKWPLTPLPKRHALVIKADWVSKKEMATSKIPPFLLENTSIALTPKIEPSLKTDPPPPAHPTHETPIPSFHKAHDSHAASFESQESERDSSRTWWD